MMLLSAFFVILNSLQARVYSFLLPAIFKSQLTLIQTRLVVHSLADPQQVFLFSLALVLFPGVLKSNRPSLVLASTTCELTWLKTLLHDLNVHHSKLMILYCDNQVALHIAQNLVFHERTKHIEIDCHVIREKLQSGLITTRHISTSNQLADIFTKALGRDHFQALSRKLGITDLHAPT